MTLRSDGLRASQAEFASALREPEAPVPHPLFGRELKPAGKRFDIYRNNVAVAEIDALQATYPTVCALVGEEFFRASARIYASETPPQSPLLFRYGASFPDFLEDFPPAQSLPYLGDVARLEWARLQAYHAADVDPIGLEALAEIDPQRLGELSFSFHPSAHLTVSRHPIVSLWGATNGLLPSEQVDMKKGEDAFTVRPMLEVNTRTLPSGAAPFFAALGTGESLGDAAEIAAAKDPDFDLSTHLAGLFETGAVTAISLQD